MEDTSVEDVAQMTPANKIVSFEDFVPREPVPVKRYRPKKETFPPGNPFFRMDHKTARQSFTAIDDANVGNNQDPAALRKTASNIESAEYGLGKRVALIGHIGIGKSTLMNQILCVNGLCRTSTEQTTCTQVAISYHHYQPAKRKRNKSELRVEVDLLTERDCNILRATFQSEIEEECGKSNDGIAAKSQAEAYLTALCDLAGRTHQLDPAQATSKTAIFIDDAADFRRQFDILTEPAIARVLADQGETQRTLKFYCDDVQELHKKLDVYTRGERTCVVKCIRVYVQDTVLKHGCILVDLPGVGTSSILEQFMTRENKAADIYIIVHNLIRVLSNVSIRTEINKAMKLTLSGAKDVFLVITHPDVLVSESLIVLDEINNREYPPFSNIKSALEKDKQSAKSSTSTSPKKKGKSKSHSSDSDSDSSSESDPSVVITPKREQYEDYLMDFAKKAIIDEDIKIIREWAAKTFRDQDGTHVRVIMAAPLFHRKLVWPGRGVTESPLFTPEETGLPAIRRFLRTVNTD